MPQGFNYRILPEKDQFFEQPKDLLLTTAATNVDFKMLRFRSINLGTLGGISSMAHSINDAGQIVGISQISNGAWRGFLWQNNIMQMLSDQLPADQSQRYRINNSGHIVSGRSLLKSGVVSTLPSLPETSWATAINDVGTIAGDQGSTGFLFKDGLLTGLSIGNPYAMNNREQIVGGTTGQGAVIMKNGQTSILPVPAGYSQTDSAAYAINDSGIVVGYSFGQGAFRAMKWENGAPQDLTTGIAELLSAYPRDINERGLICGEFRKWVVNSHVCIWDEGSLKDLHELGPGFAFSFSEGLNNADAIIANWTPGGSSSHFLAYAIVPVITPFEEASTWRFLSSHASPASDWYMPGADDSTWSEGRSILGYGESYVGTVVPFGADSQNKPITTYFRRSFDVQTNSSRMTELTLSVCYDDGIIVYLNGQVVANRNIPVGAGPDHLAVARESNHPMEPTQPVYEKIDLSAHAGKLVKGNNVIAVEVHQSSADSDDLVWDAELTYEAWRHPESSGDFVMDYDDDGLPDQFEWRMINQKQADTFDELADVLPNGDYDGDGSSNADEVVAGTDPILASDSLRIKAIVESSPAHTISLDGKSGRTYFMERSTSLNAPWAVVRQIGPLAASQEIRLSDLSPPTGSAFYRVRVSAD